MRVAIIGRGRVGTALGNGWSTAGHQVVYGARSVNDDARGPAQTSVAAAIEQAEVVVLATPFDAAGEVVDAHDFGGRVVIDATNPIGAGFSLLYGQTTSGAEQLASRARGARVVKAFNTTGFENLASARSATRRPMMPVASDDEAALAQVTRLAEDLGFEAVGLARLSQARVLEPLALLWISLARTPAIGRSARFTLARRTPSDTQPVIRAARPRAITVVGTGNIGGALATAWLKSGHQVRLAVRDHTSAEVAALTALGAQPVAIDGAARGAEIVVLAVPGAAAVELCGRLGNMSGTIVVDCTNAIGPGFTLLHGHTDSSSEVLARALPGARVVRSFNQQGAETLQSPRFDGVSAVNFVAADDAEARAVVRTLAEDVGLRAIEVGPLASARLLDPITLLWVAISRVIGNRQFALTLT